MKAKAKTAVKKRTGRNPYSDSVVLECKDMFINREMSGRQISKYFGGKPTAVQISRWSHIKDHSDKDWYDYRRERAENLYISMSPENLANAIFNKIQALITNTEIDPTRFADALYKMQMSLEKLTDPALQIPTMYHMLQDFVLFTQKHNKNLVSKDFIENVQAFKNHIRGRLL